MYAIRSYYGKESQFSDQFRLPFLPSPREPAIVIRKQDIAIDGKIEQFLIARSDGSPFDDRCHITNLPNHVVNTQVAPGSDVRRGQAPCCPLAHLLSSEDFGFSLRSQITESGVGLFCAGDRVPGRE